MAVRTTTNTELNKSSKLFLLILNNHIPDNNFVNNFLKNRRSYYYVIINYLDTHRVKNGSVFNTLLKKQFQTQKVKIIKERVKYDNDFVNSKLQSLIVKFISIKG